MSEPAAVAASAHDQNRWIEGEMTFLKANIRSLAGSENDTIRLRACKLYYDVLCDEEALERESTRQQGRPLRIIFRGREIDE